MKGVFVNYNSDPQWIKEYFDDYIIYDRSDVKQDYTGFDKRKIKYAENVGHCDYDKLCYLVKNYYNLPEAFYWGKVNLWKSITKEEFKKTEYFTPLLTQSHSEKMCDWDPSRRFSFYKEKMYYELNNSWYLNQYPSRYFRSFNDFAREFGIPAPEYLPFAPGGNYFLTRKIVHKYPRSLYKKLSNLLPYTKFPGEAYMMERAYYLLWQ